MFEIKVEKDRTKNIVTGAVIVVLFFTLSLFCDILRVFGFFKQMLLLIYCVFCCYYLLRFTVANFTYIADDSQLIIKKISKHRAETIYYVNVEDIKVIAHKKNPVLNKYDGKSECVTAGFFDPDYYVLVYKKNKIYKKIKLENSKELILAFKEAFGNKVCE